MDVNIFADEDRIFFTLYIKRKNILSGVVIRWLVINCGGFVFLRKNKKTGSKF